jgi:hypothetical protein
MPSEVNLPQPERPTSSNIVSVLLLAGAILWCIYWFVHAWHYWEDDAYIHLEFARSVAAGRGFSFNGHVVAGDTAPLWVLLLAAMHALIPDWMIAGKALTVLGAIVGLTGIYAFARRLAEQLVPTATVFPAAMVLLTVANPYSCYWLFSGMEPIAAAGLACFAVLAATRERPSTRSFLAACLLAGIAPLLRPEMILLTALLVLPLLAHWRRLRASPTRLAAGLILLAGPLLLWSIYSLHAFGHVLPNTNAAKRAAPGDSVVFRLASIYSVGFPVIICGLLAAIACLGLRPSSVRRAIRNAVATTFARVSENSRSLPFAGWIFILWPSIAAIFYIANHTYVQTRYILVTAPGLTIVILALALRNFPLSGRALYLAALVWAVAVSVLTVRPFLRNKAINCQTSSDLALFIRDRIPPDAPVATYSIGEIAFVSEHPIVDTGGITRPGAIPYLNAPPDAMLRWARSQGAQYYISSGQPEPGAIAVYTVNPPFIGWTLRTSVYSTSSSAFLWKLPASSKPQPGEISRPVQP